MLSFKCFFSFTIIILCNKIIQIQSLNKNYTRKINGDFELNDQSSINLNRNIPVIRINNTYVEGMFSVNNITVWHDLNLLDSEANPLYSFILSDLIIDGNKIFDGTIIILNTVIGGKIRIDRVSVSRTIVLDATNNKTVLICPEPFSRIHKGSTFNGCYYYKSLAGNYDQAVSSCKAIGARLIKIKNKILLNDLPIIYRTFSQFYYWIGAYLKDGAFRWDDLSIVNKELWCSGYPSGTDMCTYTTQPTFSTEKCIRNGKCGSNWFDTGVICQYLHPNANFDYY